MQITKTQSQPSFQSARFRNPDQFIDYARNREFTKILDNAKRAAKMPAQFQIQYTPGLEIPLWVSCTKDFRAPLVARTHRQEVPIYRLSEVIDDLYEATEKEHNAPIVQIPEKSLDKRDIRDFWNAMRVAARGIIDVTAADPLLTHLDKNSVRTVLDQLEKIDKPTKSRAGLFLGFNPRKEKPFSVGCIDSRLFTAGVFRQDLQAEQIARATREVFEKAQLHATAQPLQHNLDLTSKAHYERQTKIWAIEAIG